MNNLCGAFANLWYSVYNTLFRNVSSKVKYSIAVAFIVLFLITFINCTKGKNKNELINNWFLFWISMIFLIIAVLYLSF